MADQFCNFDNFEDDADLDLKNIISEPENNKRVMKNILTEAQILQSLESLVQINHKFSKSEENENFDVFELFAKISRRAKIRISEKNKIQEEKAEEATGPNTESENEFQNVVEAENGEIAGKDEKDLIIRKLK